jgi:hypothetical protein
LEPPGTTWNRFRDLAVDLHKLLDPADNPTARVIGHGTP